MCVKKQSRNAGTGTHMTHTRCEESADDSRAGVVFISNILLTSGLRWDLQRVCARARFNSKE